MQDIGIGSTGRRHPTVLLMVQEPIVREVIAVNLRDAGFHPLPASSLEAGRRVIADVLPDAFVLDLDATDRGGLALLRDLQAGAAGADRPVLCLTSTRAHHEDACAAHDCLAKPFSPRELVARLARLVATRHARPPVGVIRAGLLELDPAEFAVRVRGPGDAATLHVAPAEFRLLHCLASAPDRVHTREHLVAAAWRGDAKVDPRTVDQNIRRLRAELRAVGLADLLETVRGFGYRLRTTTAARTAAP